MKSTSNNISLQESQIKTSTEFSNLSQAFAPHQPLSQKAEFNLPSTSQNLTVTPDSQNKQTTADNFFPSLISAQTDEKEAEAASGMTASPKTVNEAFRLAFEHWRGISADTPEVNFSRNICIIN